MVFRPPFVIPRLDRGIQGGPLRPCRGTLDPAIKSRGDTEGEVRETALAHVNPSAHGMAVTGIGESRTRPALTRRRYWKQTDFGRKPQARPARMAASGGRTGAGQALPCVSNPANPASTLHTLERAWTRWGQLFQGVTGFGTPPPIQCAPVTCASRLSARTPRSQGAASRPAFRASALPPRSGRPGCPCGGRSWQRVCGRWQGVGKSHPHIPHATASLRAKPFDPACPRP
jgi:hypothetical protein